MSPGAGDGPTYMSDRKVVLKMVMSFDGFVTSPDGTHDWMFRFFGDDSNEWNLRALEEAGTHAMGRRSYDLMGPHWQASEGPIASSMNDKPKAVFSDTLKTADWGPAEIFSSDLTKAVADLKAQDIEGTILVHGGPTLTKSLVRLNLVDEYQLVKVPLAIGSGQSPFADLQDHFQLDLVEERRFKSGAHGQILVPTQP
jgi:dihydrofolate reductase